MKLTHEDFPIFRKHPEMVYLDSAATTLKPQRVIDVTMRYYQEYSANIHRGLYPIAEEASAAYEQSRKTVSQFLNARSESEIIFTKGATESLNLLATVLSEEYIKPDREVLTTIVEHHANFVPWQQKASRHKAHFKVLTFDPLSVSNEQILEMFRMGVTPKTSILTLTYVSNVLGAILPIKEIVQVVRAINPHIMIVLDACQAVTTIPIDVQELDVDFLVFSGHKSFGPTGVGVLYGKKELLNVLPPYQMGGDMIEEVSIERTTFAKPPSRFEAGTPPIAESIGLGEALGFLTREQVKEIAFHSAKLRRYAVEKLTSAFGSDIALYTNPHLDSVGVLSFNLMWCHPHDVAQLLADDNVCIRAGHHCAQPLHTHLNIPASCRMSFSIYNTKGDIDDLIVALTKAHTILHS